jgi:hypothetical protein
MVDNGPMTAVPTSNDEAISMPLLGMLVVGISSAIVVAASFVMIRYWPLPVSIAPYFGGRAGLVWGAVAGSLIGLCLGFLVDEKNFSGSNRDNV